MVVKLGKKRVLILFKEFIARGEDLIVIFLELLGWSQKITKSLK